MDYDICFSCLVGVSLLISSVAMTFMKDERIFMNFMNLLDPEQKVIYLNIIIERTMIYVCGMILGLILGLYYYVSYPKDKYRLCTFLAIVYLVKLSFYYLVPKQPLMLYSLKTKQQTDAWATIYSEMKYKWKISLFIGLLGYLMISLSMK
jgi:hypothetical protein